MSNRHRLPYAALGGFLAVILGVSLALAQEKKPPVLKDQPVSQGQKTPDKKEAKAEGQKNTPPPEQLTPALHQIESAIRELVNQQRAAQEKGPAQHEIKDLEAQDDMAFWAKLMFIATMVAVGLTGFGIWLIKRTLDETKVAAKHTEGMLKEARKTTEAAHAAIQATDKNAERQLRAYIVADTDAEWEQAYEGSPDNIVGYNFAMKWKNCGVTPARRCQGWTSLAVFDEMIPSDFDYPDKLGPKTTETSQIGSGQRFPSKVGGLSILDAEAAERGEKHAYVWSWLEYDDIFGEVRRRTEVCYELRISKDGTVCTPTIIGPFNGADEDCLHKAKT